MVKQNHREEYDKVTLYHHICFFFFRGDDFLENTTRRTPKKLKRFSISNFDPWISHMLFADDSLFFYQANKKNDQALSKILREYGEISSQHVNLDKSF